MEALKKRIVSDLKAMFVECEHGSGQADGKIWTYRAIADEEGNISHVRAWQIVRQTEKNLQRLIKKMAEMCAAWARGRSAATVR